MLGEIEKRMADLSPGVKQDKTHLCTARTRTVHGSHEHERFDFLGYTFRPRRARNGREEVFTSFLPAVSDGAAKEIRRTIRNGGFTYGAGQPSWTSHGSATRSCEVGSTTTGGSTRELAKSLKHIDRYLVRWAMRKYKRLKRRRKRAWELPGRRVRTRAGAFRPLAVDANQRPDGGSRMTGDCHVRFCESRGAQSPRPLTKRKVKKRHHGRHGH